MSEDVTASEPGERDVAMVFQSYALYPHMTVGENIAFPLRMISMPHEKSRARCATRPPRSASITARAAARPAFRRTAAALRAGARDRS